MILRVVHKCFPFIKDAYLNLQTQLPFVATGLSLSICCAINIGLIPKLRSPNFAHYPLPTYSLLTLVREFLYCYEEKSAYR